MLSKKCYQDVGPFDERFLGAYCEDCDYHVRMHRKGWVAESINYPFLHHASGTIKSAGAEKADEICKLAQANRDRFYEKWGKHIGTPEYDDLFA
jgi:GT2 family glycosyltransferase